MLTKPVEEAVLEVLSLLEHQGFGHDVTEARKDPEAFVFSLLKGIKEELPVVSAMLEWTVSMASGGEDIREAKKRLGRPEPAKPVKPARVSRVPIKGRKRKTPARAR